MADLIPKDTDEEMLRYQEAEMVRNARIPIENNAALKFEQDTVTNRENAYFPLSSGGYVKIGDRAVTPAQAAETDALAAERDIQNDTRGPISEVMGGADGPTMEDYEAAGFTEAEVRQFQAQERAQMLSQPGVQVPVQLTPEQIQYGMDVGAPMIMPRATSLRDRVQDVAYAGLKEFIDDPNDLRFWSNYLTDVADIMVPGVGGAISMDEGARLFNQGVEQGNAVDMLIGGALTTLGVAELVPLMRGLSEPARNVLRESLSPAAKNLLADTIGASRAIAQGDRDMLLEIFQPAGTPRSLGAAGVDTSYRMQHQPRGPQEENPIRLDDLTKSTTGDQAGYPEDFYSSMGPRLYAPGPSFQGDDFGKANQESYRAIKAVRGKPDAEVTIYRAVPDDPSITTINEGDFVTLSRTYAELHGASGYGPRGEDAGKILEQKVKVKDIYWDGNDVNEFGYFPSTQAAAAPGAQQFTPEYLQQIGVQTPPSQGGRPGRISTRLPTAARATEDPMTGELIIGYDELRADPKVFEPNVNIVRDYPNMRPRPDATTDEVAEEFITHVKDNLLYLHDQVPEATRARSQLWYDGARNITDRWSQEYNVPDTGIAGALAALSPQKDWYQNVSLAQRVLDVVRPTTGTPTQFTPEMEKTFRRIESLNKPKYEPLLDVIRGKSYDEITDPDPAVQNALRALFVRLHDQTYTSPDYRIVGPEGDFLDVATNADGSPSRVGWGSLNEIGKAIGSIEANGDVRTISRLMGERHKVRNFYNNIYDPNSPYGDVTIDTHAVAAGLLRPLSGNSLEVDHNFKNISVPGRGTTKGSAISGVSGNYGLYAEAYRRAAAERGILPRQMQSITWEAARGLFPDTFKTEANANMIDAIWNRYRNGEIEIDEARRMVNEAAGGINPPTWEQ